MRRRLEKASGGWANVKIDNGRQMQVAFDLAVNIPMSRFIKTGQGDWKQASQNQNLLLSKLDFNSTGDGILKGTAKDPGLESDVFDLNKLGGIQEVTATGWVTNFQNGITSSLTTSQNLSFQGGNTLFFTDITFDSNINAIIDTQFSFSSSQTGQLTVNGSDSFLAFQQNQLTQVFSGSISPTQPVLINNPFPLSNYRSWSQISNAGINFTHSNPNAIINVGLSVITYKYLGLNGKYFD